MAYYAVIDTNILVSALLSSHDDAATVQVVNKIFSGDIIPLFSKDIIDEYQDVLHRNKFHFDSETVNSLIYAIEHTGLLVSPMTSGEHLPDIDDLPFYETALTEQGRNAYLLTGNIKHFPNKQFILTANEFLQKINI